jgi:glucose/arabinose dehydrogenase
VYAIVELPEAPWTDAAADVEALLPGYHLVTVTSEDEEAFIEQLLVDVTGSSGWEWWLGGFQDVEVETDPAAGWKWVTGEPWSYTDWREGEPNDGGGMEDHLALDSGAWNDEGTALGIIRGYIAELGRFDDVPADYWAFDFIESLWQSGITGGCGNNNFCPEAAITRAQMAVFLVRAMYGGEFVPPPAVGNVFLDVGATDFAADYIEQLFRDGITVGCGNNNFCPGAPITRAQMAVFLLRAIHGPSYTPPPATGVFDDVDLAYWAVAWIEQLAAEGITGGCGGGSYCPDAPVTRAQMAVFIIRAFEPPPPPSPPPPAAAPQVGLQQVFANLTPAPAAPVSLQQAPQDATRWFIVEQAGTIRAFANDDGATATLTFLDISAQVISGGERGLLGMAFHPDFPTTPEVFVSYTGAPELTSYVSRFSSSDGGQSLDSASEEVILSVPQDFGNHNGGNIVFGADGYLYIGFGDGGSGGDPLDRAQDNTNLLGTMVRIDVDGGVPYAIPSADPGNPFAANQTCPEGFTVGGEACPEIFAWGLRNPWRFSFDRQDGDLWAGDVGQSAWEEIDVVTAGGDYGWDDREGAHCFEPATDCITDSIDPITEYGRDLGASVTGGFVYRGSAVPDMVGWYVFGDFVSGRLFAIPADSAAGTAPDVLLETGLGIAAFGESVDGELFVVNYGGSVHQLVAAP